MKNKKLLILAGLFGALLIYVLLTQTGDKGFNTVNLPLFKTPVVEDLVKIELKQGDNDLVLVKKENKWMIEAPIQFDADSNKTSALTRSISEMRLTDKISDSPEAMVDFGLNTVAAKYLSMTDKEGHSLDVYLGQLNSSGTHTFARLKDDSSVYQIIGNFGSHYAYGAKDWRSLSIFQINKDAVQTISIAQKGKKEILLSKVEEVEENIVGESAGNTSVALKTKMVWKAAGQLKVLNEPKVNQFLNAFTNLSGTAIVDDAQVSKVPLALIKVKTSDKEYQLTVDSFDSNKKEYSVRGEIGTILYKLPEYQMQNFLKEINDFN